MAEIKIEKGIALPPPKTGPNGRYPWTAMEVGDSFLLADVKSTKAFYSTLAKANGKYKPKRFTSRMTSAGVRIWRTEDDKPEGAESKPEGEQKVG